MTKLPILGSQYPEDLLVDPEPYVHRTSGKRTSIRMVLHTFYAPRPEYTLITPHPVNTALADLRPVRNRKVYSGEVDPAEFYATFADEVIRDESYSEAERFHASRIARRLAAIA